MLVAAAVCPCPPLLVPEVASGAAAELEPLRLACAAAVAALAAARPDRLVVVGPVRGDERGWYGEGTTGSFAPFGVDVEVVLGRRRPAPEGRHLPASLAVGAWLLQRYDGGRRDAPYEGGDGRRVEEGRYKRLRMHMIANEERLRALGASSKYDTSSAFLARLFAIGQATARDWLEQNWAFLGKASSVRIAETFL